jgi:hypothetical protein
MTRSHGTVNFTAHFTAQFSEFQRLLPPLDTFSPTVTPCGGTLTYCKHGFANAINDVAKRMVCLP